MKQLISIIFFLSFYFCSFSQEIIIEGKVQDLKNNTNLSFANIGIANKNVGTVSNENGAFRLKLIGKENSNDTILFTYVGYKTKNVLVYSLKSKYNIILLEPKTNVLSEVVIKPKRFRIKEIGRSASGFGLMHMNVNNYYEKDVHDWLSKESGMRLAINKECKIKDLNFNITSNQFKSVKFRVNFYKIENGLPTELIVDKNIIFEIKDAYLGWFNVNLEHYNINFHKDTKEVVVAIQWVESKKMNEKSKYFAISTAISPFNNFYYRDKAMAKWGKGKKSLSFYLTAMVYKKTAD